MISVAVSITHTNDRDYVRAVLRPADVDRDEAMVYANPRFHIADFDRMVEWINGYCGGVQGIVWDFTS